MIIEGKLYRIDSRYNVCGIHNPIYIIAGSSKEAIEHFDRIYAAHGYKNVEIENVYLQSTHVEKAE